MSWSIMKTIGEPARVKVSVEPQFDSAAKAYEGKAEAQDILSAKASILAFLDTVPADHAAIVEASGSRGDRWLTVTINCSTARLA